MSAAMLPLVAALVAPLVGPLVGVAGLTGLDDLDPVPADSQVGPGLAYALVFGFLVLVTVLLWLNMRKQLRRIRFPAESPGDGTGDGTGDGSDDRTAESAAPTEQQRRPE